MKPAEERELIELWLLAGEGAADAAQVARLNELIETNSEARAYLLQVAGQQGWLAWHASHHQLPEALATLSGTPPATSAANTPAFTRGALPTRILVRGSSADGTFRRR